jgi:hypothetical protein
VPSRQRALAPGGGPAAAAVATVHARSASAALTTAFLDMSTV